uniref:Adiponectin n=1 Tax=Eisenia fetida TaxID=6396 RepID=A0A2I7YV82_EISFE|nr:adiponectin [Eisenia fetida]
MNLTERFPKSPSLPAKLGQPESKAEDDGSSKYGKYKRSASSWDLISIQKLPDFLNDNEYLLNNHRPELNSAVECLKSVFKLHTETWNIWTHAVGSIGSLILSVYYLRYVAEDWQHRLSFSIFFFGAVFCMGASAIYHAFICHSERVCKFLAKIDYCGVIILIMTSYIPWLHFAFYCQRYVKLSYMVLVTVLGLACISVVVRDEFREPCYRWLRLGLFAFMALVGLIPATHYLISDEVFHIYGIPMLWLASMAILYLTGGLAYGSCIPERLCPGKFDIWCQSHQILHVCVIGGVLTCFQGAANLASAQLLADPDCITVNFSQ